MRGVIGLGVLAFAAAFAAPASAQMCGGGMQMAQAQTQPQPQPQAQGGPAQPPGDMIMGACGMGSTAAGSPARRSGMCGCCQNMAMMRGMMGGQGMMGQGGGQGSMPGMDMPGMQMPSHGDQKPADPPKQP